MAPPDPTRRQESGERSPFGIRPCSTSKSLTSRIERLYWFLNQRAEPAMTERCSA
jgi:hypothetical protein